MRAVLGLLLIFMGLAMAVLWMPAHDGERQLAVVTEIATQGLARVGPADSRSPAARAPDRDARTFSPQTPLVSATEQTRALKSPAVTVATAHVTHLSPATQLAPARNPVSTIVVQGSSAMHVINSSARMSGAAARPDDAGAATRSSVGLTEGARFELVRNIQRELKRVGCYGGEIDGSWGAGSKRAMSTFTERANATLPVEEPDFILLTLLKGHFGQSCGRGCPAGQAFADGGRCIPNAVIAQAQRKAEKASDRTARRGDRDGADDRFARGTRTEPLSASTLQQGTVETQVTQSAFTTTTATAVAGVAASVTAAAALSGPLSGRMAMGGPRNGVIEQPAADPTSASRAVRIYNAPSQPDAENAITLPPARSATRDRERRPHSSVASAQRGTSSYRAPRYASAPRYNYPAPQRRSSRGWTANFFGINP